MGVADLLAERMAGRTGTAPEATAIVSGGDVLAYGELDAAVTERAGAFAGPSGAVHPIVADAADVGIIVELLASWRAGLVPVVLNARLSQPELARARAVLADTRLPRGTQVVLWTSGTSGRPRGVALSAHNLRHITEASARRLDLRSDDVWVASLSPAHVGGLVLVVRALLLGNTLIAPGASDPAGLAGLLADGASTEPGRIRPTHVSLVPVQLERVLDVFGPSDAPEALRCVLVGGAHAPAPLVARATAAGWPIALTYGCTEMSSQIATASPGLVADRPGSVGPPLDGIEVRIAADGELLARGPTRALGYVGAPGQEGELADEEGWYHTGDLGRLDDEGHLHITGRRIDRIVSGGVTIDAIEVEEAVRADPTVADVCVVGVPDPIWGERVAALVVPVEGEFDPETVAGHLRDRLMAAKVPRVWRLAVELPRNPNGKVDRAAVRALLSESRSTRPS